MSGKNTFAYGKKNKGQAKKNNFAVLLLKLWQENNKTHYDVVWTDSALALGGKVWIAYHFQGMQKLLNLPQVCCRAA